MSDDGIRIFVGIALSDEVRIALEDVQFDLMDMVPERAINWSRPELMHLTLNFLGDGNRPEQVAAVCDQLDQIAQGQRPFSLRMGPLGCFPRRRNPEVIYAGLQGGTQQLYTLKEALDEGLATIGYVPESRKYTPHLTLGRVRKPDQVVKAQFPFGSHTQAAEWLVDGVHVYHSFRSKKRGIQYKVIHTANFSAG